MSESFYCSGKTYLISVNYKYFSLFFRFYTIDIYWPFNVGEIDSFIFLKKLPQAVQADY